MNIIAPLASGVHGAGNGTVDIYKRGTTIRPSLSYDANSTVIFQPTGPIQLDANGGIELYADGVVDCTVRDSSNNLVRKFTWCLDASQIEITSQSFTGHNRVTGVAGVGFPVQLSDILDLYRYNADGSHATVDWKVNQSGVSTTLFTALNNLPIVESTSVKAPAYGAKGDNSTDDTTAIQNCITAVSAAGGGIVFFPPGTYMVTSGLAVPAGVQIRGAGAGNTVVTMNHATQATFNYTAGGTAFQYLQDISLQAKVANSGSRVSSVTPIVIERCVLGGSNSNYCPVYVNNDTIISKCWITSGSDCAAIYNSFGNTKLIDSRITVVGTYTTVPVCRFEGSSAEVTGNQFDATAATGAALSFIRPTIVSYLKRLVVTGNEFIAPGGVTGTQYTYMLDLYNPGTVAGVFECNNMMIGGIAYTLVCRVPLSVGVQTFVNGTHTVFLGTRASKSFGPVVLGGAATYGFDASSCANGMFTTSDATNVGIKVYDEVLPVGAEVTLHIVNTSGVASGTVTITGSLAGSAPTSIVIPSLPNNTQRAITLKRTSDLLRPIGGYI